MIRLNDLKIGYRIGGRTVRAVDGVTLTIPDGCIVGVAGESGCGKSTLMKAIYGDITSPMALLGGSIDYGMTGSDGITVCGYDCKAGSTGRVSCAAMPGGQCTQGSDGHVYCTLGTSY